MKANSARQEGRSPNASSRFTQKSAISHTEQEDSAALAIGSQYVGQVNQLGGEIRQASGFDARFVAEGLEGVDRHGGLDGPEQHSRLPQGKGFLLHDGKGVQRYVVPGHRCGAVFHFLPQLPGSFYPVQVCELTCGIGKPSSPGRQM